MNCVRFELRAADSASGQNPQQNIFEWPDSGQSQRMAFDPLVVCEATCANVQITSGIIPGDDEKSVGLEAVRHRAHTFGLWAPKSVATSDLRSAHIECAHRAVPRVGEKQLIRFGSSA